MMRPTCSLLVIPFTIVTTGTISTPALCQIFDRFQFHIEQVADLAMRVGRVADAIGQLQVRVAHASLQLTCWQGSETLRELDSICRGLHGVVSNFAGVAHGIQKIW